MSAGYTPGPWRNDSAGVDALVSTTSESERAISIDCTRSGASVKEDQANACLIAAAPDLLEALKELVECPAGQYSSTDDYDRAYAKAVAAIRKATGAQ